MLPQDPSTELLTLTGRYWNAPLPWAALCLSPRIPLLTPVSPPVVLVKGALPPVAHFSCDTTESKLLHSIPG